MYFFFYEIILTLFLEEFQHFFIR